MGLPLSEKPHWTDVALSVYELHGASMLNTMTELVGLGGAYHLGVEVYWLEWSYGSCEQGSGVHVVHVGASRQGLFKERVPLGRTTRTPQEVVTILGELRREWLGRDYNLLRRNCAHFCAELIGRLGVQRLPTWAQSLAHTGSSLTQCLGLMAGLPEETVTNTEEEAVAAVRASSSASSSSSCTSAKSSSSEILHKETCDIVDFAFIHMLEEPFLVKLELEWRWARDYILDREVEELQSLGAKKLAQVLHRYMLCRPLQVWGASAAPRIQLPRGSLTCEKARCSALGL